MRIAAQIVVVIGLILLCAWGLREFYAIRYGKPILTLTRMNRLMSALAGAPPKDLSAASLDELAVSFNQPNSTLDAWGQRFLVTEAPGADPPYEIRSLGRDGRLGSCCQGFVDNPDEDAVLRGGTWLQGWR